MKHALALTLFAFGCAGTQPRVLDVAPQLTVDSPTPGLLVLEPEVDVRGHFHASGRAPEVWVSGHRAQITGDHFVAAHVPLTEGKTELAVDLLDGKERTHVVVPLVAETHDRPRAGRLCDVRGCVRYEVRGTPKRDDKGTITNAVVVLTPFGSDQQLDEVVPDLVGPGRALDSRRFFIVGVAPPEPPAAKSRSAAADEQLVYALFGELGLAMDAALVGTSTYGSELALRLFAHEARLTGPLLVVGGHDRPYLEPFVKDLYKAAQSRGRAPLAAWRDVAFAMTLGTYTRAYLEDPSHAIEHGLTLTRPTELDFESALADAAATYFAERLGDVSTLRDRLESALALEHAPLVFDSHARGTPKIDGRRAVLVANKQDRLATFVHVQELATRLERAGARVSLEAIDDPLGHAVFFRRVPMELERGIATLLAGPP